MGLVSRAVDLLPGSLWASPGNLIISHWGDRAVIGHWNLCVGGAKGSSVRTVEGNGRTVAHGRHDFDAH